MSIYSIIIILILLMVTVLWLNRSQKSYEALETPTRIRRWRDSVPKDNALGGEATLRQEQDDWWDRSYNSGQGFQLG